MRSGWQPRCQVGWVQVCLRRSDELADGLGGLGRGQRRCGVVRDCAQGREERPRRSKLSVVRQLRTAPHTACPGFSRA